MKYLYLNKSGVIIDIVETVKYIRRNKNGIDVPCTKDQAEALIGADNETIYAVKGANIIPSYSDITDVVAVEELDEAIVPLKYKYIDGVIETNWGEYPESNITLTQKAEKNAADIEYIAMMAGVEI